MPGRANEIRPQNRHESGAAADRPSASLRWQEPSPVPSQPAGPDAPAASFAEWLAEALRSRGITKETAAEELGVSPKTMHRWLGGQTEPRLRDLRRIEDRFGDVRLH